MRLEKPPRWEDININHLEGRTAGFFSYGDEGANEMDESGRPKILRHKEWFRPEEWPSEDDRNAYAPLVLQCRWSGIEVPDELWMASHTGVGLPYAHNQAEDLIHETKIMSDFDAWVDRFTAHVRAKGRVPPGKFRAFGYKPPGHRFADLKLKWRDLRMRAGHPPEGPRRRDSTSSI